MWIVLCIRFDLFFDRYILPQYLGLLESSLQFVLYVGTYFGIFLCCVKWESLVPKDSAWLAQQGSHPYPQQLYQQQFYPSTGQYPQQYGP